MIPVRLLIAKFVPEGFLFLLVRVQNVTISEHIECYFSHRCYGEGMRPYWVPLPRKKPLGRIRRWKGARFGRVQAQFCLRRVSVGKNVFFDRPVYRISVIFRDIYGRRSPASKMQRLIRQRRTLSGPAFCCPGSGRPAQTGLPQECGAVWFLGYSPCFGAKETEPFFPPPLARFLTEAWGQDGREYGGGYPASCRASRLSQNNISSKYTLMHSACVGNAVSMILSSDISQ